MRYLKSLRLPKTHCSTLWHPWHPQNPRHGHLHRTDPLISEVAREGVEDELLAAARTSPGRNLPEIFGAAAQLQYVQVKQCSGS